MPTIFIGTSGFSYREWVGQFYPKGTGSDGMLRFYASRFSTVELNNTFYHIPSEHQIDAWRDGVPGDFRFAIKANRKITHSRDFGVANDTLGFFLSRIARFGDRLGPVLFQFPPWFGSMDRLAEFISLLQAQPAESLPARIAIELRHEKLLTPQVAGLLRENRIALCCNDDRMPVDTWPEPERLAYLRLRNAPFTSEQLERVASLVGRWAGNAVECFLFFKHEDEPPTGAMEMGEIMKKKGEGRREEGWNNEPRR